MSDDIVFKCTFCSKHFKTESGFLRHHCDKMKRAEEFASIAGQAAYEYYNRWIYVKYYGRQINPDSFKTSIFFKAFYNFHFFIKRTSLPDITAYINLMVRIKIEPKFWCSEQAYRKYLEYITYQLPLPDHVKITVNTLFTAAEEANVQISDVFTILTPNDIIQLLHQRRLSPWVLLKSKKFASIVTNVATNNERTILQAIIKPDYWAKRFEQCPEEAQSVIKYVSELGI